MAGEERAERASDGWELIRDRLEVAAAEVSEIAQDAAQLIAEVPFSDSDRKALDPRRSTIKAAQFVSSINYEGDSLLRKAQQIESAPAPTQGEGAAR